MARLYRIRLKDEITKRDGKGKENGKGWWEEDEERSDPAPFSHLSIGRLMVANLEGEMNRTRKKVREEGFLPHRNDGRVEPVDLEGGVRGCCNGWVGSPDQV